MYLSNACFATRCLSSNTSCTSDTSSLKTGSAHPRALVRSFSTLSASCQFLRRRVASALRSEYVLLRLPHDSKKPNISQGGTDMAGNSAPLYLALFLFGAAGVLASSVG